MGDGKPLHRRMQGHIVLDNIDLGADDPNEAPTSNLCSGHCNFDAGFCGWNNDDRDDFDWKLVKIEDNFLIERKIAIIERKIEKTGKIERKIEKIEIDKLEKLEILKNLNIFQLKNWKNWKIDQIKKLENSKGKLKKLKHFLIEKLKEKLKGKLKKLKHFLTDKLEKLEKMKIFFKFLIEKLK